MLSKEQIKQRDSLDIEHSHSEFHHFSELCQQMQQELVALMYVHSMKNETFPSTYERSV